MENITQGQFWSSTASADLGDEISQSLRFFDGSKLEADIQNDFGDFSATCTLSFWIKFANSAGGSIWFAPNIGGNGYDRSVTINTSNQFQIRYTGNQSPSYSTECFRDKSAWYHVMVISESDNVKLYVNGDLITHHTAGGWTSGTSAYSGDKMSFSSSDQKMYYLAEVNFLDGTKATVGTDLGRENDDGIWVPVAPDFTAAEYGTNGFRLQFNDSSNLGDDSAPIGASGHTTARDFTASGFETTAISSSNFDNDIDYLDTPTSNYATLNALTGSDKTLSGANLTFSAGGSGPWWGTSTTVGVSSGKWYWEAEAVGTETMIGIIRDGSKPNVNAYPGQASSPGNAAHSANSWGLYDNNGSVYHNNNPYSYGSSWSAGDVLGFAMDLENNAFWVSKNGTWFNSATQSEVEAGTTTNAAATNLTGSNFRGAFHGADSSSNGWKVNLGQRDFVYTKPSGFEALDTSKISEPTVKNGRDHFDILTYTGDGNQTRTLSGLNFAPDLVWIKHRNGASTHNLQDTVRGAGTNALRPDVSNAEGDGSSQYGYISAFTSDGFTVNRGSAPGSRVNSDTSQTYVAWCWNAGGTAVSNTDGTITSNVSANTDAGFSIVSYTGNATSGATIGHGLNSAPQFMIVRNRDDAEAFAVYHHKVNYGTTPENYWMRLDNNSSKTVSSTHWNDTAPTNSVFTVGNANATNGDDDAIIAYCWHEVEGFSKFGIYTGNGSSDGPFVYTGFRPAWVLIKRDDSSSSGWLLIDSAREPQNPCNVTLSPAEDAVEETGYDRIDMLANGFKTISSWGANNASGSSYLYMAFAENPFGGENTPPATAR